MLRSRMFGAMIKSSVLRQGSLVVVRSAQCTPEPCTLHGSGVHTLHCTRLEAGSLLSTFNVLSFFVET